MAEHLLLKWGTIKGWSGLSKRSQEIIARFYENGMCMSAARDRPDEKRRAVLCELIEQFDGEITNDWSGEKMTKEEAKKYIAEYHNG